ncbi:sugar transferase [Carnobacterium pleistocenium]|uniref:sugar transferase n=1 Tax=Carnobacterium pleistocenium TaxID=181073 RepID=UPI00054F559A|nr:sugar transferase [Carnobacterium pleistocenium]
MYQKLFKRVIDVVLALLGIIILLPVFLIVIIAIKVNSKGPIFFKQKRVGKDKVLFNIYKFRTMKIDTPKNAPTHLLKNPDSYITKVGKVLRKTSLDELPQLFNILKGQMSVIGPRPALWNQYDLVIERDKYKANDIYPGLTGWAQINGRDELSVQRKAALDGVYMKKIGFLFDAKCFIGTIISVVKNEGIVEGETSSLKKREAMENE